MNLPILLLLGFGLVRGDECLYDIFVSQYGEVHSSMEKLAGKYTQTGTLNGMPYWTRYHFELRNFANRSPAKSH